MSATHTPPASPADVSEPRFDFPTWLPPMLVKELRQGLRTRGFVGTFVVLQLVMVIAFLWAFATQSVFQSAGLANGFFWALLGGVLLLITPLRGLAALRTEIDAHTLDLLLLTPLTSWRIVLGKWISLLAQAALLGLALLPYGVVRYFFGSVDLVDDLGIIALLYGGCGVLTAGALWLSGLPKVVRVLVPVLVVVLTQVSGGLMLGFSSGGRMSSSLFFSSLSGGAAGLVTALFDGALLLVFFLTQAVRRLAPPAENLSAPTRGLALLTLLPVPMLAWAAGATNAARGQLGLAVVALTLVTAMELANLQAPMAVQVRAWWGGPRWRAWLGRLVLPGWPSAAAFAAVWLTLVGPLAFTGLLNPPSSPAAVAWLGVLLWVALVFPILLLSYLPGLSRQAGVLYFVLQGLFGIFSILAGVSAKEFDLGGAEQVLRLLCHVLPVSSFWFTLSESTGKPAAFGGYELAQGVMVAVVAGWITWRMRAYWRYVQHQGRRARPSPEGTLPAA